MKIAAVTDDGKTISQHFGRAQHYLVLTVEDGQIVGSELRDKAAHGMGGIASEEHHAGHGPHGHGSEAEAEATHARMASPVVDCQVVLSRGMGAGAYYSLQQAGLRPVVTDVASIEQAVLDYVAGKLVDHRERLH